MKKFTLISLTALFALGCSFILPYNITFTTLDDSVVDPASAKLDVVLTQPALAYISGYNCDGQDPVELLPVVKEDMEPTRVHKLSLALLDDQPTGAHCKVSVTAFDRTTTSTESSTVWLYIREHLIVEKEEEPAEETPEVEEHEESILACNEAGGTWNECGSACADDAELCIQVCVPQCEFPNEPTENISDGSSEEEPGDQPVLE